MKNTLLGNWRGFKGIPSQSYASQAYNSQEGFPTQLARKINFTSVCNVKGNCHV